MLRFNKLIHKQIKLDWISEASYSVKSGFIQLSRQLTRLNTKVELLQLTFEYYNRMRIKVATA